MNRFFVGCALLVSCVVAGPSQAQQSQNFTPAPLFPRDQITQRTLPNGVRAVFRRATAPDQVCVQVWVRAGSRYEQPRESGAAHMIELLALDGSARHPAEDGGPRGEVEALGGAVGALTSRDGTFYSATVAKPFWSRALGALANAVLEPEISNDRVDEARFEAYQDQAARVLDPVAAISDLAYTEAFEKHPYRKPPQGIPQNLANLSPALLRSYHARHYVGRNISVVIVGDVTPEAAMDGVRRAFERASSAAPPVLQLPVENPARANTLLRRLPTLGRATALAWRSPGINAPADVMAMDVLLALWREGRDANLRAPLRRDGDEDGANPPLATAYEVDYLTQRDPGLFMVQIGGYSDPNAAVGVVLAELKKVQDGVSDAELRRAKDLLRRQYIEQSATVSGQAGALGFYEMIATWEFAAEYLNRIERVSAADVSRVARQYLATSRLLRVEIQPDVRTVPQQNDTPAPGVLPVAF